MTHQERVVVRNQTVSVAGLGNGLARKRSAKAPGFGPLNKLIKFFEKQAVARAQSPMKAAFGQADALLAPGSQHVVGQNPKCGVEVGEPKHRG